MGENDPLTQLAPTTPDQLTGMAPGLNDLVSPVRVEVMEDGVARQQVGHAEPSPTLDALRRTIATAEERLSSLREQRQLIDQLEQQLLDLQSERDQLSQELNTARQQLAEVDTLQRQLQVLLEQS